MVVLAAAGLALGFGGCQRTDREGAPPVPVGDKNQPSQEIGQFTLRETDAEGRLTWALQATTAQVFEERDEVEAETLHIDFYGENGQVTSVLTADRGIILRRTNDMRALGHVVVRNAAGDELLTEELAYDAPKEKIRTDAFVTLIRGRDILTGYGLEADPDLAAGTFEIQRDVRATVRDLPADQMAPSVAPGAIAPEAGSTPPAVAPAGQDSTPGSAAGGTDSAAGNPDAQNAK
jgi:LPS export ABC transporter protein LptC